MSSIDNFADKQCFFDFPQYSREQNLEDEKNLSFSKLHRIDMLKEVNNERRKVTCGPTILLP